VRDDVFRERLQQARDDELLLDREVAAVAVRDGFERTTDRRQLLFGLVPVEGRERVGDPPPTATCTAGTARTTRRRGTVSTRARPRARAPRRRTRRSRPEPTPAPTARNESKSAGVCSWAAVSTGFATPDITTFTGRPLAVPPHSSMSVATGVPSGRSYTPGFATSPDSVKPVVPGDRSVPVERNASAPSAMIHAACASDSTLFTSAGFDQCGCVWPGSSCDSQPSWGAVANGPCS
jgi:hypothetical protein